MVSGNLKGEKFIVITLVITTFLLGVVPITEAKRIGDEEVDEMKTFLKISNVPMLRNFDEKELKKLLNKAIKPEIPDFTYGLLVLGTQRDIEWMDMILSQKFLDRNKAYFNNVLDKRLNLFSHYKKLGQDIYFFASKGDQIGPLSGLASEIVSITNKTIEIFVAFDVWKTTKTYKGIWRYFDARRWGYSHEEAWGDAKAEMGWAAETRDRFKGAGSSKTSQLEAQFVALWDKWGPYATPFGISEEYKKQVKNELNDSLVTVVESQSFAEEPKPSLLDKIVQQLKKIKDATVALVSRVNPFQAGPVADLPENLGDIEEIKETEMVEALPRQAETEEIVSEASSRSVELEIIETGKEEVSEASPPSIEPPPIEEPEAEEETEEVLEVEPEPILEAESEPKSAPEPAPEPTLCEIRASYIPVRFKVLINEIAWMGTNNSANDEWIELRNIWGIPINLSGWQLLDKTQQIKVIFGEDDIIPANGFYLLERTDDESVPSISADLIYTGALSNTNEALYLFDNKCQLEDRVLAEPDWPAGDNTEKKPMERLDAVNWYTGITDGTPKAENSSPPASSYSSIPPPTSSGSSSPPTSEEPSLSSFSEILISEVQIESTESGKDEFIELYNFNDQEIDISQWSIQKTYCNSTTTYKKNFETGNKIPTRGYFLIVYASSTDQDLLNLADMTHKTFSLAENNTVYLVANQEKIENSSDADIIDMVGFGMDIVEFRSLPAEGDSAALNPPASKSIGRKWSTTSQNYIDTDNNQNDFEIQHSTPGTQNQSLGIEEEEEEEAEETLSLQMVINEIAWMGTDNSSNDEWIELYNNTSSTIDITGWQLISADGSPSITFSTSTIAAHGFYLLERTDEQTVSDISADQIYTGALNNDGEKLELRDSDGDIIDEVNCLDGWLAGDNSTKQTMERIDENNWANNNQVPWDGWKGKDANGNRLNGTPKSKNSVVKDLTTVTPGGFQIENDFTLALLGSPYLVEGSIRVIPEANLTIEPGVIMKLKHSQHWRSEFKIEGSLEAIGGENQSQKIIFTSFYDDEYGGDTNGDSTNTQPTAGDWEWLYFQDSQTNLKNVIIRYAGKKEGSPPESSPFTRGAVYIDGGDIKIENSVIEKSQTLGVWLKNSNSTLINGVDFLNIEGNWEKAAALYIENSNPIIKNSTFKNNKTGIWIEREANSLVENNVFEENEMPIKTFTLLPSFSNNIAQNNNFNGILVSGFGFSETVSQIDWKSANLPYIFESWGVISTGKTLNIQAGAIVKLKNSSRIYIEGTLQAQGNQNEKIVFTSINDDEYGGDTNNDGNNIQPSDGNWNFISFSASSTNSIFDNVIVRYGGWYNVFHGGSAAKSGAIKAERTSLTIRNSAFENNLYSGLELNNSTSTIENTVFKNHRAKYGYSGEYSKGLLLKNSTPIFTNSAFNNNYYGIYVEPGDCPDLSEVTFPPKEDENANSVDIHPSSCSL